MFMINHKYFFISEMFPHSATPSSNSVTSEPEEKVFFLYKCFHFSQNIILARRYLDGFLFFIVLLWSCFLLTHCYYFRRYILVKKLCGPNMLIKFSIRSRSILIRSLQSLWKSMVTMRSKYAIQEASELKSTVLLTFFCTCCQM